MEVTCLANRCRPSYHVVNRGICVARAGVNGQLPKLNVVGSIPITRFLFPYRQRLSTLNGRV